MPEAYMGSLNVGGVVRTVLMPVTENLDSTSLDNRKY